MKQITYSDLFIPELDQNYIDGLIDERDVDCSELDITYIFESDRFNSAMLTNAIIGEIFHWIIMHYVDDMDDQDTLLDWIYTNAFCSGIDVNPEELKTDKAKDLLSNFGW